MRFIGAADLACTIEQSGGGVVSSIILFSSLLFSGPGFCGTGVPSLVGQMSRLFRCFDFLLASEALDFAVSPLWRAKLMKVIFPSFPLNHFTDRSASAKPFCEVNRSINAVTIRTFLPSSE